MDSSFGHIIIAWYNKNKRDLPWRRTKDPYKIWISEVILQQTRIIQGLDYYTRFVDCFKDIYSLASAGEDEVLKLWQGLGYYTRARNLHKGAKQVVNAHGGIFPREYKELIKIAGIGDYTASAIASISFGQETPVMDGNVMRVVSRYYGIVEAINSVKGKELIKKRLEKMIIRQEPGTFNQALMELGALVCSPKNPQCAECPVNKNCFALISGQTGKLPIKIKKHLPLNRYFNYLVMKINTGNDASIYVIKRKPGDIWANLYDLPLIESARILDKNDLQVQPEFVDLMGQVKYAINSESEIFKHQLTHRKIHARFFEVTLSSGKMDDRDQKLIPVKMSDFHTLPISRLIERYFCLKKV